MSENKNYHKSQAIVLGLVAGLLIIYGYLTAIKEKEADVLLWVICLISITSVISKHVAHIVASIWMKIGFVLGKLNGTILLAVVYVFIVTPIGWIKKVFAPNTNFKNKKTSQTGFVRRGHVFTSKDIELPW